MGSTARWLVCLPYTEGQGSDTSEVHDFHAFVRATLKPYKYASVVEEPQRLATDVNALIFTVYREGFVHVVPWLQMHRPSMSSAIIVPVVDPGKHNVSKIDLVDRALWLGPQWNAASWDLNPLHEGDASKQGTQLLPASQGWGKKFYLVPSELAKLRDIAASSLYHFHAHVFLDPDDTEGSMGEWRSFYKHISETFKNEKYVVEDAVVERPIGPHPVGQFEIVFFRPAFTHFLEWLQFNRPPQLPILIHPMLYNTKADALYGEYYDHGRRAMWLGRQVSTLGLDFLATLDEKVHAGVNRPYEMFDWQRPRGEK